MYFDNKNIALVKYIIKSLQNENHGKIYLETVKQKPVKYIS